MRKRAVQRQPLSRTRILLAVVLALAPVAIGLFGAFVAVRSLADPCTTWGVPPTSNASVTASPTAPGAACSSGHSEQQLTQLEYGLSAAAFIAVMLLGGLLAFFAALRESAGLAVTAVPLILLASVPLGIGGEFVIPWAAAVALVALARRWPSFTKWPQAWARGIGLLACGWLVFAIVEAVASRFVGFALVDAIFFPEIIALAFFGLWPVKQRAAPLEPHGHE
ncbi:MAG: hypothetical protein ACYDCK_06075 [Thermoplasmatota archaeon]